MTFSTRIKLINEGSFRTLFLEELGWDRPDQPELRVDVDGISYELRQVAGFAGLRVWLCPQVPDRRTQRLIDKEIRKVSTERLVIFADDTVQEWRWLQSADADGAGQPRLVMHRHRVGSTNEALDQRLQMITVGFDEDVSLMGMLRRMRRAFDADQVTRRFYTEFIQKQRSLSDAIEGIDEKGDRDWYAALTMNRLMFIYFLQRKHFMDNEPNYLRDRLEKLQQLTNEQGSFYSFYCDFLIPLFHEGLGQKTPKFADPMIEDLVGDVRYINGGIFAHHELELNHDITIGDAVFEAIFNLFDGYQWHLDDREGGNPNEINPDVLGYIFEQFINQKQMGAYYTKEDVTHFMTGSTLLAVALSRFEELGLEIWPLLRIDPDRYTWDGLKYGKETPFPDTIEAERAGHVRPSWLDTPPDDIAFPGESWWDVDFRRSEHDRLIARMQAGEIDTVDKAVSENLDLETLVVDVIDALRDPAEVHAVWQTLTALRIVDPTCGSGAFLFAALKVLLPLYEATLDAARAVDSSSHVGLSTLLSDIAKHPNSDYFLLKHASLSNLYGVDIMKEAVEVARLRLFLKLISAIDDKTKLEPLPDLDFNIKPGNILVGALHADEIEAASDDLLSGLSAGRVAESARRISSAFSAFRNAQEDDDDQETRRLRSDLLSLLEEVRDEVNQQYFAAERRGLTFDEWVASHHPFHWFIEFPEVFDRGGFDIVVGNPPYIAKGKITEYTYKGFRTDALPDIYAPCTERASQITNDHGRFSLIVPISATFGDDYEELRKVLKQRFNSLWVSNFSRNPAALFSAGLGVRSTILVGSASGQTKQVFVTKTHRWYDAYRPALFETLRYFALPDSVQQRHGWVRLPSADYGQLLEVVGQAPGSLSSLDRPRTGTASVGFKQTALYWLAPFLQDPPAYERDGRTARQTKVGRITVEDADAALLMLAVLASKFAFVWWYATGDDFDVTSGGLKSTPIDPTRFSDAAKASLIQSARALLEDFDNHILFTPYAGKYMGTYVLSEMRDLTDAVDEVIAAELGFTELLSALEHAYSCVYKPTGDRPGTLRSNPFTASGV